MSFMSSQQVLRISLPESEINMRLARMQQKLPKWIQSIHPDRLIRPANPNPPFFPAFWTCIPEKTGLRCDAAPCGDREFTHP